MQARTHASKGLTLKVQNRGISGQTNKTDGLNKI